MEGTHGPFTLALSVVGVLEGVGYFIITPQWLDHFRNSTHHNQGTNVSTTNPEPENPTHQISMPFLLVGQWSFTCAACVILVLILRLSRPDWLRGSQWRNVSREAVIGGFSMGLSSILFNYSVSGTRTSPYLQGLLGNFEIPIQFFLR